MVDALHVADLGCECLPCTGPGSPVLHAVLCVPRAARRPGPCSIMHPQALCVVAGSSRMAAELARISVLSSARLVDARDASWRRTSELLYGRALPMLGRAANSMLVSSYLRLHSSHGLQDYQLDWEAILCQDPADFVREVSRWLYPAEARPHATAADGAAAAAAAAGSSRETVATAAHGHDAASSLEPDGQQQQGPNSPC